MDLCPPVVWRSLRRGVRMVREYKQRNAAHVATPAEQDLAIYWNPQMAAGLESWGEGNAWLEIQCFMSLCRGRVLDIACGTGKVMAINSRFPQLELYGCDISDFLIGKAIERGVPTARLKVCDATATGYDDAQFQYAYSIGSLEHFTEPGIAGFLRECRRISTGASFHHIPTAARRSRPRLDHAVPELLQQFRRLVVAEVPRGIRDGARARLDLGRRHLGGQVVCL